MRFVFAFIAAVAIVAAFVGAPSAGLAAAKASPSPSPSPTATPEPPDVAIPHLQARLKINPNDRDALMQLAGNFLQINRPDLAEQAAQRLLQLGTKNGQVYYLSGFANLQLNRLPQATSDLENASNLEPTNLSILSSLADVYTRQNRFADAERVAKRAITFNKDDKSAYEMYGGVLESEQKFDDARVQYEIAAKMDPKDPQPVLLEARSYLKQNAIALAGPIFDRALTIDPNNIDALNGKAQTLAAQHDVKGAIATFERIRTLLPGTEEKASVSVDEARVYASEKMNDLAVQTFKDAIAQYPSVLGLHLAYGDYLAGQKDLDGAAAEWQLALGPNRDNKDALGRIGTYYADKKDYAKAADYLKRLTEISPSDPRGWSILGSVYASQTDWKDAHDAFRHAYDLTHAPDVLKALGQTDLNLHNYREAQQIFEAIEKNAGDYVRQDPSVIYMLGQSYQKQGLNPQAKSAYQRFLAYLTPGTQAYTEVQKMIQDIGKPSGQKKQQG
ncbi:MAG TPA: tetratricopeptide repeat protein [Candidatus Acidoferrales bacterium]|nr:tetratricopeptide repeat protein [Candidatus Acidoferrales bacterium]